MVRVLLQTADVTEPFLVGNSVDFMSQWPSCSVSTMRLA